MIRVRGRDGKVAALVAGLVAEVGFLEPGGVPGAFDRVNLVHAPVLILDLSEVNHIGVSAALALEEVVLDMARAEHEVYLVGAKGQPLDRLYDLGLKELLPEDRLLANREAALRKASKVLSAKDREIRPQQGAEA